MKPCVRTNSGCSSSPGVSAGVKISSVEGKSRVGARPDVGVDVLDAPSQQEPRDGLQRDRPAHERFVQGEIRPIVDGRIGAHTVEILLEAPSGAGRETPQPANRWRGGERAPAPRRTSSPYERICRRRPEIHGVDQKPVTRTCAEAGPLAQAPDLRIEVPRRIQNPLEDHVVLDGEHDGFKHVSRGWLKRLGFLLALPARFPPVAIVRWRPGAVWRGLGRR